MRFLIALLVAPLLLAPVRLKDSTPGFFTPPAQSPAPESYSLPAAEPLVTPTIIYVSPTILPLSPTSPVTPTSLNLPLPPSPTAQPVKIIYVERQDNRMPEMTAALCARAMQLVEQLSLLSYNQKRMQSTMTLSIAAIAGGAEAKARQWPNLKAFNRAEKSLPWFGVPNKAEIQDATVAARRFCQP